MRAYPGRKALDWTGVGKAGGQNLKVHVREEEQITFSGPERYALAVDAMKFVEDACVGSITSLLLPEAGNWAGLRPQMRKHKLSLARKKDSKSLGDSAFTWDEIDAFFLLVRALALGGRSRGSLVEFVA